jgi:hypothetical protein
MSDSDTDDSISITTEEYEICDKVEEYEEFIEEYVECINNHYYIGSHSFMKDNNDDIILLFDTKINVPTFYAFSNYELSTYIYFCSGVNYDTNPTIEIMQVKIQADGINTAVLKTFWIKIIQRTWKKIMAQRTQYMYNLKKNILSILNTFQLTNRISKPPGLHGLLSHYNDYKKI